MALFLGGSQIELSIAKHGCAIRSTQKDIKHIRGMWIDSLNEFSTDMPHPGIYL